jgi:predicted lipoprotein with Yx(FWY)xxD motif
MPHNALRRAIAVAAIAVAVPVAALAITAVGTDGVGSLASPGARFAQLTAARTTVRHPLVITITVRPFGRVLATPRKLPLYTFGPEHRDHRVHCVGSCATTWPPLLVARTVKVPRHIAGITGTFGTIRRPNKTIQLTRNALPLYAFAFDTPGQATGNGVGGFVVVRR